jgi:hypothetical protein
VGGGPENVFSSNNVNGVAVVVKMLLFPAAHACKSTRRLDQISAFSQYTRNSYNKETDSDFIANL